MPFTVEYEKDANESGDEEDIANIERRMMVKREIHGDATTTRDTQACAGSSGYIYTKFILGYLSFETQNATCISNNSEREVLHKIEYDREMYQDTTVS